jgi:hypothetical protein
MEEIDYSNNEAQSCVVWAPTNAGFTKGEYKIEVYNKGFQVGTSKLTLK